MAAHRGDLLGCPSAFCKPAQGGLSQPVSHASRRKARKLDRPLDQVGQSAERLAAGVCNDVLHSDNGPRLESSRQGRVYRDHQFVCRTLAGLVLGDTNTAVDNIGPEHLYDIPAALSRIEQQSEREPFSRAEWPAPLELSNLSVRPGVVGAEPIPLQPTERIIGA